PTAVTVLFDAAGASPKSLGPDVRTRVASTNAFNPETIVLALATVGMLLIALVAVGGFTVLAQRRLRSVGMLGALGATDKNIGLVVRANGLVVGLLGTLGGFLLGVVAWLLYRPHVEASSHHVIATWSFPWAVILPALVLAVLATYFAAARPARVVARMPVVAALAGRPAPPRQVRRSAMPGLLALVVAFALLAYAGSRTAGGGAGGVVLGLVCLVVAVVLLAPMFLAVLPKVGRRAPVAVRLALRDLSRYRARSGSALGAISLGVLIAVVVCVLSVSRYGNALDYAGPNLARNQLVVYTTTWTARPDAPAASGSGAASHPPSSPRAERATADRIAAGLGAHQMVQLDDAGASLLHAAPGRGFTGPLYVATAPLLRALGIKSTQVDPHADLLTMRPGLSGVSDLQLRYGQGETKSVGPTGPQAHYPCPEATCVANPVIQEVGGLPSGTSAPNTVVTEHAVHRLGLHTSPAGWLIQTPQPLTAAQIGYARQAAAAARVTVETMSDAPTSTEIINWATVFGMALALGILALTVGLIRSETAGDLRILAATGASSSTRRALTAATAGSLALLGAVVGTVAGYVACIAYTSSNAQDGLSELGNVPLRNLLILVVGMPLIAVVVGWVFAGRAPSGIGRRPDA
ncbi:MAG TPA: FtsX-like permease family protein, partial [Acidimicrobiales bacterium]|nr:FtsX-like permease family protein [Acidimicrobiales bacterium]